MGSPVHTIVRSGDNPMDGSRPSRSKCLVLRTLKPGFLDENRALGTCGAPDPGRACGVASDHWAGWRERDSQRVQRTGVVCSEPAWGSENA